jgi:hypothetical protein
MPVTPPAADFKRRRTSCGHLAKQDQVLRHMFLCAKGFTAWPPAAVSNSSRRPALCVGRVFDLPPPKARPIRILQPFGDSAFEPCAHISSKRCPVPVSDSVSEMTTACLAPDQHAIADARLGVRQTVNHLCSWSFTG